MSQWEQDRFLILVVSSDETLSKQLMDKIKKKFNQMPLTLSLQAEGKQAMYEFEQSHPQLVFISDSVPGLRVKQFVQNVHRLDGGTSIVILVDKNAADCPTEGPGIFQLPIPILNWEVVYSLIIQTLPDVFKERFGIKREDSHLLRKVNLYAQKYHGVVSDASSVRVTRPVLLIPRQFDAQGENFNGAEEITKSANGNQVGPSDSPAGLSPILPKSGRPILELMLLGLLTTVSFSLFWKDSPEGSWPLVKNLFLWATLASYFGFFLSYSIKEK